MIKNVVFDFGQVLVHFVPEYMVRQYACDDEDVKLLSEVIFDRLYWDRLDLGTITDEETIRLCRERLPEHLWEVAEKIHWNWIYNIPEIDGMYDLVKYLKEKHGVRLFVLSNISHYFADHSGEMRIFELFDGAVFSSRVGVCKPDHKIFAHVCEKFGIKAEETVFVDDNANNISSSNDFGLKGYLFDGNSQKLKEYLDATITND